MIEKRSIIKYIGQCNGIILGKIVLKLLQYCSTEHTFSAKKVAVLTEPFSVLASLGRKPGYQMDEIQDKNRVHYGKLLLE